MNLCFANSTRWIDENELERDVQCTLIVDLNDMANLSRFRSRRQIPKPHSIHHGLRSIIFCAMRILNQTEHKIPVGIPLDPDLSSESNLVLILCVSTCIQKAYGQREIQTVFEWRHSETMRMDDSTPYPDGEDVFRKDE